MHVVSKMNTVSLDYNLKQCSACFPFHSNEHQVSKPLCRHTTTIVAREPRPIAVTTTPVQIVISRASSLGNLESNELWKKNTFFFSFYESWRAMRILQKCMLYIWRRSNIYQRPQQDAMPAGLQKVMTDIFWHIYIKRLWSRITLCK